MLSLETYVLFTYPLSLSPRLLTPQLNPDVNPFQRSFVGEIRRIEEMARRVRFFAAQIERERDPISIRPLYDSAPLIAVGPRAAQTIDDLDVTLNEHESRLLEMNSAYELLSERLAELIEARHVLRETAVFFRRVGASCGYHISSSIRALLPPLSGRIESERDSLVL
jgi:V-type H+-transporting ATPase subunit a